MVETTQTTVGDDATAIYYQHPTCSLKFIGTPYRGQTMLSQGALVLTKEKVTFTSTTAADEAATFELINFSYPDFVLFGQSSDPNLLKINDDQGQESISHGCIFAIVQASGGGSQADSGQAADDDDNDEMSDEVQFTIHVRGCPTEAEELSQLVQMREAFEHCNMANPCVDDDDDSDSDGEMITAETLLASEA